MELPICNAYIDFSRHQLCCFTVAPLFVLDKSTAWNRCLQCPCFQNLCKIARASKNSDSNAQHFLSDLLTHSWFHSMPIALLSYLFPYTVMNRFFYLSSHKRWCGSIPIGMISVVAGYWEPQDCRIASGTSLMHYPTTLPLYLVWLPRAYSRAPNQKIKNGVMLLDWLKNRVERINIYGNPNGPHGNTL
jgi:hypothetical protein